MYIGMSLYADVSPLSVFSLDCLPVNNSETFYILTECTSDPADVKSVLFSQQLFISLY